MDPNPDKSKDSDSQTSPSSSKKEKPPLPKKTEKLGTSTQLFPKRSDPSTSSSASSQAAGSTKRSDPSTSSSTSSQAADSTKEGSKSSKSESSGATKATEQEISKPLPAKASEILGLSKCPQHKGVVSKMIEQFSLYQKSFQSGREKRTPPKDTTQKDTLAKGIRPRKFQQGNIQPESTPSSSLAPPDEAAGSTKTQKEIKKGTPPKDTKPEKTPTTVSIALTAKAANGRHSPKDVRRGHTAGDTEQESIPYISTPPTDSVAVTSKAANGRHSPKDVKRDTLPKDTERESTPPTDSAVLTAEAANGRPSAKDKERSTPPRNTTQEETPPEGISPKNLDTAKAANGRHSPKNTERGTPPSDTTQEKTQPKSFAQEIIPSSSGEVPPADSVAIAAEAANGRHSPKDVKRDTPPRNTEQESIPHISTTPTDSAALLAEAANGRHSPKNTENETPLSDTTQEETRPKSISSRSLATAKPANGRHSPKHTERGTTPKDTEQESIPYISTPPRDYVASTAEAANGKHIPKDKEKGIPQGKTQSRSISPKSIVQGNISYSSTPPPDSVASAAETTNGRHSPKDTERSPRDITREKTDSLASVGEAASSTQTPKDTEKDALPMGTTHVKITSKGISQKFTSQENIPSEDSPTATGEAASQVDLSRRKPTASFLEGEEYPSIYFRKNEFSTLPALEEVEIAEPSTSSQQDISETFIFAECFEESIWPISLPVVGDSPTSPGGFHETELYPTEPESLEPPKTPKFKGKSKTGKSTKSSKKREVPKDLPLESSLAPSQEECSRRLEIPAETKPNTTRTVACSGDVLLWWKSEPGQSKLPHSPAYLPRCEPIPGFLNEPDVSEEIPGTSKDSNGWTPEEEIPIDLSFPDELVTYETRRLLNYAKTFQREKPELAKILIDELKREQTEETRQTFPLRSYVEVDSDNFFTEILEFFSYSEECDLAEFERQFTWYLSDFGFPQMWTLLDERQRTYFINQMKNEVQSQDVAIRKQAADCISYIALGCWSDFSSDSQQEANLKINSILLFREGFFNILVDLLKREAKKIRQSPIYEQTDFLATILGVLYTIVETMRWVNDTRFRHCKKDLDCFLIDLLTDSKEDKNMLIVTLFDLIDRLTSCKIRVYNFPFKKILLLLWKSILFVLGSPVKLEKQMKKKQTKTDSSSKENLDTQEKGENEKMDVNEFLKKTFEKYINVPSPTTAEVPFEIASKIDTMLSNLYRPFSTEGVASNPEIATNMTEFIFQALYPRLRVYIASLQRVMCFIVHTKETREFIYVRERGDHYNQELRIMDQQRYKEIISKATLAILKLLMIHSYVYSTYAYHHICEILDSFHFITMSTFLYRDFYSLITNVFEEYEYSWQRQRRVDLTTYSYSRRNMFTCTTFIWVLTNYIWSCPSVPEELEDLKVWMWTNLRRSFFIDNVPYKQRVVELIAAMERKTEREWKETLMDELLLDHLHWEYRLRLGDRRRDRVVELLLIPETVEWQNEYYLSSNIFDLWFDRYTLI